MKWQNLPPLFLYPPIIPHVTRLCLKYVSAPSLISFANPIFEYGGLPFASKSQMLEPFNDALPYAKIKDSEPFEKKLQLATDFISIYSYPVILKPDTGHRGVGVELIKNDTELKNLLNNQKWDLIIQQFDSSVLEFGIFYIRFPNEEEGFIHSVTKKDVPFVLGNGNDNIEELVIQKYGSKHTYHDYIQDKKKVILEDKKRQNLHFLGSHNRGAIFTDVTNHISDILKNKVISICKNKHFYFGRFDVKCASLDDLNSGKFNIIEINGATSEFIHIYDSKYSYLQGMKLLKEQWELLFKVSKLAKQKHNKGLSFKRFISKYLIFFKNTKNATGTLW